MESIGDLMGGFAVVLSWQNLLYMFIGVVLGVIIGVLVGGAAITLLAWLASVLWRRGGDEVIDRAGRAEWRMPPLDQLPPPGLTRLEKTWMTVLRAYLVIAGGLVLFRIAQLAFVGHA